MSNEIKRVVVLGAGGVGFHLVTALCRDWPGVEKVVYDSDNFEGGLGHARLPRVADPRQLKVEKLRGYVRMVMGDEPPQVVPARLDNAAVVNLGKNYWQDSLVVDATDMGVGERRPLWSLLRSFGATMLRVSYDGNGCVVVARGLPICASDAGGYALVPSYAQSLMAGGLGAEAVGLLLKGHEVGDYQIQLPRVGAGGNSQ